MFQRSKERKPIRLKEYDYSEPGDYFVTICIDDFKYLFGEVIDGDMILNILGKEAEKYLLEIPKHFSNTEIEIFQVMPNHVHFMITILCNNNVGVEYIQPLQNRYQHVIPKSISSIVRCYKSSVTRWANKNGFNYFKWQRGYYEEIIKNEKHHSEVYDYILSNPSKWDEDRNNLKNIFLNVRK